MWTPRLSDIVKPFLEPIAASVKGDRARERGPFSSLCSNVLWPDLRQCLDRLDRDPQTIFGFEKDFIATAIKQIDPGSPKPLFTSNELMPAVRTVSEYLMANQGAGDEPWKREINIRMRNNFWSQSQILEFAEQIGGVDSSLRSRFISKVLEVDPTMEKVFNSRPGANQ